MRTWSFWPDVVAVCVMVAMTPAPGGASAQTGPGAAPPGAVGVITQPPTVPDPVVAGVEGHAIHFSEVGDAIRAIPGVGGANSFEVLYPAVLARLIEREALVIRAQQDGVADDPAVRRRMQAAADQALENAYLEHVTAKTVTEQMLLKRYDSEVSGKPGPDEVHGRAVLVSSEAEARDIITKLAAGADFATLARQFSQDKTAGSGGDLGFVSRDRLRPEIGAVLFALRPGEVTSYPVKTSSGWFVLQAVARQPGPTPSFAEVRDRLEAELQRADVVAATRAALNGMTVHAYDMNGHVVAPPNVRRRVAGGGGSPVVRLDSVWTVRTEREAG